MKIKSDVIKIEDTVELRYNAVLKVRRSDPRYIWDDGYNTVFPPPRLRMACIRGRSSHIINIFTI